MYISIYRVNVVNIVCRYSCALSLVLSSHSFNKLQAQSSTVWRFNMYDIVHEYYHMAWLPPPLNVLCHLANIFLWLVKCFRRCCTRIAIRKHRSEIPHELQEYMDVGGVGHLWLYPHHMRDDCCFCCYIPPTQRLGASNWNHFRM